MLPRGLVITLVHDSCQCGWERMDSQGVRPAKADVVLAVRDGVHEAGRDRDAWCHKARLLRSRVNIGDRDGDMHGEVWVADARDRDDCSVRKKTRPWGLEKSLSVLGVGGDGY